MHYVRLKPPSELVREGQPHRTKMSWGIPSAQFYCHDIGDGTLHVPGFAAADLIAAGCTILEINTIEKGVHVSVGHLDVSRLDIRDEIATAPDHLIEEWYLKAHDARPMHEFHMHTTVARGERAGHLDPNPNRPSPAEFRARALAIHDAKVAKVAADSAAKVG